jgi:hypothetical protein
MNFGMPVPGDVAGTDYGIKKIGTGVRIPVSRRQDLDP